MSKADGTAFGRPFAPMIAMSMGGGFPTNTAINNEWNDVMAPYYQDWAHPDDGIQFGIYFHSWSWRKFYNNHNNRPSNPTNPNDSNYDWSYIESIKSGVTVINNGTAKVHFRIDTEGNTIPGWIINRGDTFLGTGNRLNPAWHRTAVLNDFKDFLTAFANRYNGQSWFAHFSFEEANVGTSPPGDYSLAQWNANRANYVRHAYNNFTQHTVFLAQSANVHELLTDIPVGRFCDDLKPGAFSCGSSNQGFPVYDCVASTVQGGIQRFNGTISNPTGGIPRATWCSSQPNGWGSRADGTYGRSNPWGLPYPIAGETSNSPFPAADPDWNAMQHLSYIAGEPRASSPNDDSGLGQSGRDNAGIIPSMVVLVIPNDTPQAWNRAFQTFGKNGTRACPAVPHDWFSGGTPSTVQANPDIVAGVAKNSTAATIVASAITQNDQGQSLSITSVFNAQNCTAVLNSGPQTITFTPNTDFTGNATFDYTITGTGGSDTSQVTVPVGNTAPVIVYGGASLPCNAGSAGQVNIIAVDAENDFLTFNVESQPNVGTAAFTSRLSDQEMVFRYTMPSDASGLVTGCQISCTDDDATNPLTSDFVDINFQVIGGGGGGTSTIVTIDEDAAVATDGGGGGGTTEYIYGVTLTNPWATANSVDAIDSHDVQVTARIVFDETEAASNYRSLFNSISAVCPVMGEILDSFYMPDFTVQQFKNRVDQYLNEFANEVAIWEIGNEINGNWLGSTSSVVQKVNYAFDQVEAIGGTHALTVYYNEDCHSGSDEMWSWLSNNIATRIKNGVDYVLVSWWEEDCNNLIPDWEVQFQRLGEMFPNSKLGFSEVGSYQNEAKRRTIMNRAYGVEPNHPRYIGGHFWWFYNDDCVPKTKPLWTDLNNIFNAIVPPISSSSSWEYPPGGTPGFNNIEGADWTISRVQIQQSYIDVAKPSNAVTGSTLVLIVVCDGGHELDMSVNPPAGWVSRHQVYQSTVSLAVFDKVLAAGEPSTYRVEKVGPKLEEWAAFAIVLPAGSIYNVHAQQNGTNSTGIAPAVSPTVSGTFLLQVVASNYNDDAEDVNVFSNGTMIGNKWSSNTAGSVMLAAAFENHTTTQASTANLLALDRNANWEGVTVAYTLGTGGGGSSYADAFNGDTLLSATGNGTGTVCYTAELGAGAKDWLKVYMQWPSNSIVTNTTRVTTTIGGLSYPDATVDQSVNGGQFNEILSLTSAVPSGDAVVCIYDSSDTPVFADAVRIEYGTDDPDPPDPITFTVGATVSAVLKASKVKNVPANAFILLAGDGIVARSVTARANGILKDNRQEWDTVSRNKNVWVLESDR